MGWGGSDPRLGVAWGSGNLPRRDEEKILEGSKCPPGYKLIRPDDDDTLTEAHLEKTTGASGSGLKVGGLREKLSEGIDSMAASKAGRLLLDQDKEKTRGLERKRELDLDERKMAVEEKREKRAAKAAKATAKKDQMLLEVHC